MLHHSERVGEEGEYKKINRKLAKKIPFPIILLLTKLLIEHGRSIN